MTLLRLVLAATSVALAALAVGAFAPVLPFAALAVLGLGLVSVAMIGLARLLRRWREGADRGDPTSGP